VYISVNTLCDMGATCCNVLGDLACSVAMKETVKLDNVAAHQAEATVEE
jgi:Na+/H+-dicarboxylate symporter